MNWVLGRSSRRRLGDPDLDLDREPYLHGSLCIVTQQLHLKTACDWRSSPRVPNHEPQHGGYVQTASETSCGSRMRAAFSPLFEKQGAHPS